MGLMETKLTHVGYCNHLLFAAEVLREAIEREEQEVPQRQELARQVALVEEAQRKDEEQRKFQMERRKLEDVCDFSFQIPTMRTRLIFRRGVLLGLLQY